MKRKVSQISHLIYLKLTPSNPNKVELVDNLVLTAELRESRLVPFLSSMYDSLLLRAEKPHLGIPRYALNEVTCQFSAYRSTSRSPASLASASLLSSTQTGTDTSARVSSSRGSTVSSPPASRKAVGSFTTFLTSTPTGRSRRRTSGPSFPMSRWSKFSN